MTQAVSESEIRAIAGRALRDQHPPRFIGIASPPHWEGAQEVEVDGEPFDIRTCSSVLAVRELMSGPRREDQPRVIFLTSIPEDELGDEVLARIWKHRIHQPTSWDSVRQLFRVEGMEPALADQRWLVDLLVQVAPTRGYPPPPSGLLDLDTAWKNFLRFGLRMDVERPTLEDLLRWAETDEARAILQNRVGEATRPVTRWLERTAGSAAGPIMRLAAAGKGGDLVPLGLLCDTLWNEELKEDMAVTTARIRMEGPVGQKGLTEQVARSWGKAAVRVARRAHALSDDLKLRRWLNRAEAILNEELDARELARASHVLPSSFEQRLSQVGSRLMEALGKSDNKELEGVRLAVKRVGAHLRAEEGEGKHRRSRLKMAERLVRWLSQEPEDAPQDLAAAARSFVHDGAWVDRAREALSHGETVPALAEAYGLILERIDALRAQRDERFTHLLAEWSKVGPSGRPPLLPIERVLDQVVVPVAGETPILLLVLDGWSLAEASRLAEDLGKAGWARHRPEESEHPIVVSALPSVTAASRTSLFSGRLAYGTQEDERRNWGEHEGLRAVSPKGEPRLFHRRDLAVSGGFMAPEVRDAIRDMDSRVVGVVVNALDEHLDKGGQLRLVDGLEGIRPLGPLLDAAMEAGRAVILASDHGHVLETGSSVALNPGAGERFRPAHPPVSDGEVVIKGPRVLSHEGSVIVPATERLRYITAEKRGYHGGATPQEVLCPLMVITPPGLTLAGWEQAEVLPPSWWMIQTGAHLPGFVDGEVAEDELGATPTPRPAVEPGGQVQLFAVEEPAQEPVPDSTPAWLASLIESPTLVLQREGAGRQALDDRDLMKFLGTLDAAGGVLPVQVLAEALGLPMNRVFSKLAALGRMLNVDGYSIVTVEGNRTVRFDRQRLIRQFELGA